MSHFPERVECCNIKEELGLDPINPLMQYVIDQRNIIVILIQAICFPRVQSLC